MSDLPTTIRAEGPQGYAGNAANRNEVLLEEVQESRLLPASPNAADRKKECLGERQSEVDACVSVEKQREAESLFSDAQTQVAWHKNANRKTMRILQKSLYATAEISLEAKSTILLAEMLEQGVLPEAPQACHR